MFCKYNITDFVANSGWGKLVKVGGQLNGFVGFIVLKNPLAQQTL
jgi:hypothetical protein